MVSQGGRESFSANPRTIRTVVDRKRLPTPSAHQLATPFVPQDVPPCRSSFTCRPTTPPTQIPTAATLPSTQSRAGWPGHSAPWPLPARASAPRAASPISARPAASGRSTASVEYQEFMASADARLEYWRQKSEAHADFAAAEPNAGHQVLARWESQGRLQAVITQNIDELHQRAGSKRVLGAARHRAADRVPGLRRAVRSRAAAGRIPPQRRGAGLRRVPRPVEDGHDLVRPDAAAGGPARVVRAGQACRSVPGDRLVAGGRTGGQPAARRQGVRRSTGDHQPRPNAAGHGRRSWSSATRSARRWRRSTK